MQETWQEFLTRLHPKLRAILHYYRIPRQDAEDVLQDALVLLLSKGPLRDRGSYLLSVLHYRCIMYWRSRGRRRDQTMEQASLEDLATPQGPNQEAAAQRHDIGRVLAQLPPRSRKLLQLRYALGYTARELAEQLGARTGTVKQRCTHARSQAAVAARRISRWGYR